MPRTGRPKNFDQMQPDFAAYYRVTGDTVDELCGKLGVHWTALLRYQKDGIPQRSGAQRMVWELLKKQTAAKARRDGLHEDAAALEAD